MTSTKKTEQLITVDAYKLSQGLKAAFEGVAMVFDSLGADAGFEVSEKAEAPEKKAEATEKKAVSKAKTTKKAEPAEPDTPAKTAKDEVEDTAADTTEDTAVEEPEDVSTADAPADEVPDKAAEDKSSTISLDDVTKIIVQKIKQDRSNNEKIGQILKTYGVAKVGELDADKYEAFLTDVAAL